MPIISDQCILVTPKGYRRPSDLIPSDFVLHEDNKYRRVEVEELEALTMFNIYRHGLALEAIPDTLIRLKDGTYKPMNEIELKERVYCERTPWFNDYGWTTEFFQNGLRYEDYTNYRQGEIEFDNPDFAYICGSYVAFHSFQKHLKCYSYYKRDKYYYRLVRLGLNPVLEDGSKSVMAKIPDPWFWELMDSFFEHYASGEKPSLPDDISLGCSVKWGKEFIKGFLDTISFSQNLYCCPSNSEQLALDLCMLHHKCDKPLVLVRKTAASGKVEDYRIAPRKTFAKTTGAIKITQTQAPTTVYKITNKDNLALHASGLLIH